MTHGRRAALIGATIAAVLFFAGATPPTNAAKIAEWAAQVQERTDAEIAALSSKLTDAQAKAAEREGELKRRQRAKINLRFKRVQWPADGRVPPTFPSRVAKDEEVAKYEAKLATERAKVAELEAQIAKHRNGSAYVYPSLRHPLKIDAFGTIYSGKTTVNVHQVVDDTTMLVNVLYTEIGQAYRHSSGKLLTRGNQSRKVVVMVRGVPTRGATDGAGFDLPQAFVVTGTETYPTADGSTNTVFVLTPVDTKAIEVELASMRTKSTASAKP